MLWDVLWHGHPDQGPPSPFPHHLFPSPIILPHPPSPSPQPPITPTGPCAPAGAEWQQTYQLAWSPSGSLVLASGGRSRGARPGLPLGAACGLWPAGEWAEKRARVHPAQQPGIQSHSPQGLPAPTGRAARRRLLHSCDENAASGTMTGGPRPGEATAPPRGARVLMHPRGAIHGQALGTERHPGQLGVGLSGRLGQAQPNCFPGCRAQVKSCAGLARWALTLPGQDEDSTDPAFCCPGSRAGDSGRQGDLPAQGGRQEARLPAGRGRPASRVHLACGAVPTPAPSRQEAPLAREEALLAPASEILSRRGRVDEGLRHMGQAKETAAGGPEATPPTWEGHSLEAPLAGRPLYSGEWEA